MEKPLWHMSHNDQSILNNRFTSVYRSRCSNLFIQYFISYVRTLFGFFTLYYTYEHFFDSCNVALDVMVFIVFWGIQVDVETGQIDFFFLVLSILLQLYMRKVQLIEPTQSPDTRDSGMSSTTSEWDWTTWCGRDTGDDREALRGLSSFEL